MKSLLSVLFWGSFVFSIGAQEKSYQVVAEPGDGIYSLLRKQGLDPTKHYEKFVELNAKQIKGGSFLQVGEAYQIPYVSGSFKHAGTKVSLLDGSETPFFGQGLEKLTPKSTELKGVVYYLITENKTDDSNEFGKGVEHSLVRELLENGAQVFVFDKEGLVFEDEVDKENALMGSYVEAINKRYLKHSGKYQRLLIIKSNGSIQGKMNISIYHHQKSKDGQRLAQNLREVFQKNSVRSKSFKEAGAIFQDKGMLFLAKNVLPAVSLLEIEGNSKAKSIELVSNKNNFAAWLADGILKDYADLKIED